MALAVVLAVPMSFATLIEKPARPALGSAVSAVHPLDLASLTLADFGDSN